jgi:hypothetical protein
MRAGCANEVLSGEKPPGEPSAESNCRLSYKEKREFEQLEAKISNLEAEKARLAQQL